MSDFLFIAFLLVAFFKFTHDVIEIDARVLPHHKQMIEEVTGLVDDLFFVLMLVGDDDFRGFFADLFVDLVFAFALQVIGVGLILRMGAAIFDFFKKSMKGWRKRNKNKLADVRVILLQVSGFLRKR